MILDVISNYPNHKNDTFHEKYSPENVLQNVTMVTQMLHVYISVTVLDRPIVTIIHRTYIQPFISPHDLSPAVTVKVTNGHIHEFCEKRIFSVSF